MSRFLQERRVPDSDRCDPGVPRRQNWSTTPAGDHRKHSYQTLVSQELPRGEVDAVEFKKQEQGARKSSSKNKRNL